MIPSDPRHALEPGETNIPLEVTAVELARRAVGLAAGRPRTLIGIAGSPGSGKTTTAAEVVRELNAAIPGCAVRIPMDGFHLANATLEDKRIRDRKGAPETFDSWGFLALLRRLAIEQTNPVFAPDFDRAVNEGVTGAIEVIPETEIVVVEGNYLLLPTEPWASMRQLFSEIWFCDTPSEVRRNRLVTRHQLMGLSEPAAEDWVRNVDERNAREVEPTRSTADLLFTMTEC